MSPRDAIKLVAGREISMRGKDKSFVYSTLITLGVIVVVILLNLATSGDILPTPTRSRTAPSRSSA